MVEYLTFNGKVLVRVQVFPVVATSLFKGLLRYSSLSESESDNLSLSSDRNKRELRTLVVAYARLLTNDSIKNFFY